MGDEIPQNGWFPQDDNAPMFQNLFREGRPIGQVTKSGGRWRPYTLLELNSSKTGAKPLADSLPTRDEAKAVVEAALR